MWCEPTKDAAVSADQVFFSAADGLAKAGTAESGIRFSAGDLLLTRANCVI